MSHLRLIRASAGSGKTFTITSAYLSLLFKNPLNYKSILAVTFTNKATAEMKVRILSELYKLSKGEKTIHFQNIANEFGLIETEIQQKARKILDLILHNYSRFSISTIDKFFQGIIRSFAREAGIQFNYEIALNTTQILENAADTLMLQLESDMTLLEWMTEFSENRVEEGKSWDYRKNLISLGKQVFNEQFLSFPKSFHEKIANREFLKKYHDELAIIKYTFEKKLEDAGKQGMQIIQKHGLHPYDFKYQKQGSVGTYFLKLSKGELIAPTKRILDSCENVQTWLPKEKDKAALICAAAEDGLWQLFTETIRYIQDNSRNFESCILVLRNFYSLGILADLSKAINQNAIQENAFVLAHAGPFLKAIIGDNDTPFIYEKTGQVFHHFMIDEFQDTSAIQWENFKPLIFDSLASNNYSMLVGDVKQSIYRWRNTDWKIMASQVEEDIHVYGLDHKTLEFNWRSKANIIAFNNTLFHQASALLKNHLHQELDESKMDISFKESLLKLSGAAYKDASQLIPEKTAENSGFIKIQFLDNTEKDFYEKALERLPKIIESICEKGYKLKDIAILVRKTREGRMIFDYLNHYKLTLPKDAAIKFDVLSDESAYVTSSPAVQLILKTFRYLMYPEDKLNLYALLNDFITLIPNGNIDGLSIGGPNFSILEAINDENFLKSFSKTMSRLKALPPDGLLEHLLEIYQLSNKREHLPFIQAFHDCIAKFTNSISPSLTAFLEYWEENKEDISVSISDQQDAIRIISIHKSKGLEYKNVLIPFCDWELDHKFMLAPILWCNTHEAPYNQLEAIPVGYSSKMKETVFANEYFLEKTQFMVDNLNLLYVAFTRAENNLFALSPKPANTEKLNSISQLLYALLSSPLSEILNFQHLNMQEGWHIDENTFSWGNIVPLSATIEENQAELISLENYASHEISERLRQRTVSPFFDYEKSAQNQLYGNFMHKLFQEIKTINDIESAILKLQRSGFITKEETPSMQLFISNLLNSEPYKNWFSPDWTIMNEAAIVVPNSHQYRPDRVITKDKQAIVIDYKFGWKEKDMYIQQVKEYMDCINAMGFVKVEGYVWYVSLKKHVKI